MKGTIGFELGWGFGRLAELQNSEGLNNAAKVIGRSDYEIETW